MNKLILLQGTKADARAIKAVRDHARALRAARAPLRGTARGLTPPAPRVCRGKKNPADAWAILARVQARLVHRTTNRLRLKVPHRRHDAAFFADLRQELLRQRGIVSVQVNPLTASVVIVHDGTLDLPVAAAGAPPGGPSIGGMDFASIAIKLALFAVAQELGLPIVELCAEALAPLAARALTRASAR